MNWRQLVGPVLAVAVISGSSIAAEVPDLAAPGTLPLAGRIIVIDPGHATKNYRGIIINPGAKARRGPLEREVTLDVAEKVAPLLEAQGAKVFLTRTRGNPWRYNGQSRQGDNRARAFFANSMRADAYIRLHCDWNRSRKFKGFTSYYYRWGSRRLAKYLRRGLARKLPGHTDHGVKRRSFVSVSTTMPAVLLELGVLSYKKEAQELGTDGYQTRLAEAILDGVVEYFTEKGL
jgi:N-acetylmuramoyl-L-alanine amidase